jgi:hypothetical protein
MKFWKKLSSILKPHECIKTEKDFGSGLGGSFECDCTQETATEF